MKELDKYFGSNTAEVKEVLNEINYTKTCKKILTFPMISKYAFTWDHVKQIEINKLRKPLIDYFIPTQW